VFQVGLTGAIMAWHDELNHLFLGSWAEVEPEGAMRPLGDLAAAVEAVFRASRSTRATTTGPITRAAASSSSSRPPRAWRTPSRRSS
jgi:hypothetical protein